jgi:hypothetical protein
LDNKPLGKEGDYESKKAFNCLLTKKVSQAFVTEKIKYVFTSEALNLWTVGQVRQCNTFFSK